LLKEKEEMFGFHQKAYGILPKHMEGTQVRTQKCRFLAIKENAMSGANPTPLITPRHHPTVKHGGGSSIML
jgi:hypothetical protein